MSIQNIFSGVTVSPLREIVADVWAEEKEKNVQYPSVGSFGVVNATISAGCNRENIYTSDVSIYSSLLGYLADEEKSVYDLDIKPSEEYKKYFLNVDTEEEFVASCLTTIVLLKTPATNLYASSLREQILIDTDLYLRSMTDRVVRAKEKLKGIHYEVEDVRPKMDEYAEMDNCFWYGAFPIYKGDYEKMFGDVFTHLNWQYVFPDWEPKMNAMLYGMLSSRRTENRAISHVLDGLEACPKDWHPFFAIGFTKKNAKPDYLISNRQRDITGVKYSGYMTGSPKIFPIYDNEEITEDSRVDIIAIDRDTALYYRDLFIHRLGTTDAEDFYMVLIDGRVISVMGLMFSAVTQQGAEYLNETFGVTITSERYKRLAKLFVMLVTSGSFKRYLEKTNPNRLMVMPKGIKMIGLSKNIEWGAGKGVLKLESREETKNGYRNVYLGDFRKDNYKKVLKKWISRYGDMKR